MKIIFICGSLEPGRDGVGDYTRRLAIEITKQGHKASIVAINDHYCNLPINGFQNEDEFTVEVYRIPQSFSNKKRFQLIDIWIKDKKPDWLSLQFVIYSFQSKGLPFFLAKNLKRFNKEIKWHIMFHEIWIGLEANEKYKNQFIGGLQKQIINNLIKQLSPSIIHTQLELYKRELGYLGHTCTLLNLPSNIPLTAEKNKEQTNHISFVIFGSIYPDAPINEFAFELSNYKKKTGKSINITMIGRNGNEQSNWIQIFKSYGIPVKILGEQPPESISHILLNSTIGIITTPLYLIEKSGSAAALRLHQTPIINVAKPWLPKRYFKYDIQKDVFVYTNGNFSSIENINFFKVETNAVSKVAQNFISSLNSNTSRFLD